KGRRPVEQEAPAVLRRLQLVLRSDDPESREPDFAGSQRRLGIVVRPPTTLWVPREVASDLEPPLVGAPTIPSVDDRDGSCSGVPNREHATDQVGADDDMVRRE